MIFRDWNEFDLFQPGNLIVNGDFPVDTGNWNVSSGAALAWEGGRVKFEQSLGYKSANQEVALTQGESYRLTASIESVTASLSIRVMNPYDGKSICILSEGEIDEVFASPSDRILVQIRGASEPGYGYLDDITLKPA